MAVMTSCQGTQTLVALWHSKWPTDTEQPPCWPAASPHKCHPWPRHRMGSPNRSSFVLWCFYPVDISLWWTLHFCCWFQPIASKVSIILSHKPILLISLHSISITSAQQFAHLFWQLSGSRGRCAASPVRAAMTPFPSHPALLSFIAHPGGVRPGSVPSPAKFPRHLPRPHPLAQDAFAFLSPERGKEWAPAHVSMLWNM